MGIAGRAVVIVVVVAASVAAAAPVSVPEAAAQNDRPNVLLIVTDDQRLPGTLKVMGATRRIFKRGGTYFARAFATTPLCCPSRSSIMTGRYAHNHEVNAHIKKEVLELDHKTTLQAYLQSVGYRTGMIGKYLNRWPIHKDPPFFDEWAFYTRGNHYYRSRYNVDGDTEPVSSYYSDYMRERTGVFLQESESEDNRPWMLYLATSAPHGPAVAEPRYRGAHVGKWHGNRAVAEEDRRDKPPYVRRRHESFQTGRHIRRKQLRALKSVDDLVDRTFELLDELDEENTIAVFVSDNGELWGEHGILGKNVPYTFSVKVPLMIRWPGHFDVDSVDLRLVANIDIAPTILDAVGISPDVPMDGRSLLESGARQRLLLEYWKTPDFKATPSWASTRTARDQYVEYYDRRGEITFREYYNLREDPWQLNNLLGDSSMLNDPPVLLLERQLNEDRNCSGENCP